MSNKNSTEAINAQRLARAIRAKRKIAISRQKVFAPPRENVDRHTASRHEIALASRQAVRVMWNGKRVELMRLHEMLNPPVPYITARVRVQRSGWKVEDAFYKPVRKFGKGETK